MQLTHLSQSSLQDYTDCPRRFKLRHLDRLSYPAEQTEPVLEHERRLREGEYFHRLAQQSLLGQPPEALSKLAATEDLARWWEHWNDLRLDRDFAGLGGLYPELTLSAPLGRLRIIAKYDLITGSPGGNFVIYDWKTYRRHLGRDELARRLQTRVYLALLVVAGAQLNGGQPISPDRVEMVYWFADFPSEPVSFLYSEANWQRDWAGLRSLANEIMSTPDFVMTENRAQCSFCTYRSYCDRGVRAGADQDVDPDTYWQELNLEQITEIEF